MHNSFAQIDKYINRFQSGLKKYGKLHTEIGETVFLIGLYCSTIRFSGKERDLLAIQIANALLEKLFISVKEMWRRFLTEEAKRLNVSIEDFYIPKEKILKQLYEIKDKLGINTVSKL